MHLQQNRARRALFSAAKMLAPCTRSRSRASKKPRGHNRQQRTRCRHGVASSSTRPERISNPLSPAGFSLAACLLADVFTPSPPAAPSMPPAAHAREAPMQNAAVFERREYSPHLRMFYDDVARLYGAKRRPFYTGMLKRPTARKKVTGRRQRWRRGEGKRIFTDANRHRPQRPAASAHR